MFKYNHFNFTPIGDAIFITQKPALLQFGGGSRKIIQKHVLEESLCHTESPVTLVWVW